MNGREFEMYCICEELHTELRKKIKTSLTAVNIARLLYKKLNALQINQVVDDIYHIKKRGGNVANYYILIVYPLLEKENVLKVASSR